MQQPFYDPTKSYEENYDQGPFGLFAQEPDQPLPKLKQKFHFLGFPVSIPFGIPAGPLLNAKFVEAAWRWGFSISTYKTVRGDSYPCHPFPNVIRIQKETNIKPGETVTGDLDMEKIEITHDGITNSFGVPSKPANYWVKDVKRAVKYIGEKDLLILSFMGTKKEGMTLDEYVKDFVITCLLAKKAKAPILEVNFSCPNVGKEGLICNDIETSTAILEALKETKGNTPLLVKIGYFPKDQQDILEKLLTVISQNADGVAAINTIQAKVTDTKGKQILPGNQVRLFSGICGATIKWAGLEMTERIMYFKKKKGLKNLAVIGVGGVTKPEDYFEYMKLGVDAVQSATGAMWKPDLAIEISKSINNT